jgi:hypothetical protein
MGADHASRAGGYQPYPQLPNGSRTRLNLPSDPSPSLPLAGLGGTRAPWLNITHCCDRRWRDKPSRYLEAFGALSLSRDLADGLAARGLDADGHGVDLAEDLMWGSRQVKGHQLEAPSSVYHSMTGLLCFAEA